MNIKDLWVSNNISDWENAKENYWNYVMPNNYEIEKKLDQINSEDIKNMSLHEFYNFLYDEYYSWKYTDPRWLKRNRESLVTYVELEELHILDEIHKELFDFDLDNIDKGLNIAMKLNGLGVAGASGLLAIIFPKYFGTVDRFVVEALKSVDDIMENRFSDTKIDNISIKAAVQMIDIMRKKANELNEKFNTDIWKPRDIDMILWSSRNNKIIRREQIKKSDNEIHNPVQSGDKYSLISNNMSKEKKNQLKNNYIDFLRKNYPHINTVDTYVSDALYITNNDDSLKLDIVDILKNDRDFSKYRNRLVVHFVKKGWELKKASTQSEDYIRKLALLREFIEGKK